MELLINPPVGEHGKYGWEIRTDTGKVLLSGYANTEPEAEFVGGTEMEWLQEQLFVGESIDLLAVVA